MVQFRPLSVSFENHDEMKQKQDTSIHEAEAFEREAAGIRHRLWLTAKSYLHDGDEAEDAVQEALMRCWTVRHRLRDMNALPALALRIVKNLCTDLLRGRRTASPMETVDVEGGDRADAPLLAHEQQAWMDECLRRLPIGARAVLQMKGIDELSYPEIAALLGTTEATVRAKSPFARTAASPS